MVGMGVEGGRGVGLERMKLELVHGGPRRASIPRRRNVLAHIDQKKTPPAAGGAFAHPQKLGAPTHAGGAVGRGKMAEEEAPAGEAAAPPPADEGPSEAQRMEEMYLAAFVAVGAPPVREGW